MTRYVVLVGTAGSGKSHLTAALADAIEDAGGAAARVNLDPAAVSLPYEPTVDVRRYVKAEDFMAEGLGPNGALIAAVDHAFNYAREIKNDVEEVNPDYAIIDTPGQLELFAFRAGGPLVLDVIVGDSPSVVVFLMDAVFFEKPSSIVSVLMLASSTAARLLRPQINVVSKADLLLPEVEEEIIPSLGDHGFLASLVMEEEGIDGSTRAFLARMAEALYETGFIGEVLTVSIRRPETVTALYGKIQQIVAGGDDYVALDSMEGTLR